MEEDGIAILRRTRGDERVTFSDVADHLTDFGHIEPGSLTTIDALARFLAGVERVDHEHVEGMSGSTADPLEAEDRGERL